MASEDQLDAILDETTAALATFDLDGLQGLLRRAEALHDAGCEAVSSSLVAKHQLLGMMLRSTESNLNLLRRLHGRDMGQTWER